MYKTDIVCIMLDNPVRRIEIYIRKLNVSKEYMSIYIDRRKHLYHTVNREFMESHFLVRYKR